MAIITKRRKAYSVIYQKADENGKMIPIWETYYDYKTALARKKEIEDVGDSKMNITKNTTITDFLIQYANKIGIHFWSDRNYERNISLINNYISKILGNTKINEISNSFGHETLNQLKTMPAIGKRHQSKTEFIPDSMIRTCYALLKSSFDYLVQENLIKENPFYDCIVVREKRNKATKNWNLDFVNHLFENIDDIRLFMFMHIMFSTGLGIYETNALSWDDVHIEDELLKKNECYIVSNKVLQRLNKNTLNKMDSKRIIKQFKCSGNNLTNTSLTLLFKNVPERKVHLHKSVALLLRHWQQIQQEYIISENPYNLVITLVNGKPCDDRNITKMYHRICKQSELEGFTLMKFKNFSQKISTKENMTNAYIYYSSFNEEITMPSKDRIVLPKQKIRTQNRIQLDRSRITKKMNKQLAIQDNKDMQLLLQQLKDNPELKMKLIEQIKAEL